MSLWLSRQLIGLSQSFNPESVIPTWTLSRLGFPHCSKLRLVWCLDLLDKCSWLFVVYLQRMNQMHKYIDLYVRRGPQKNHVLHRFR